MSEGQALNNPEEPDMNTTQIDNAIKIARELGHTFTFADGRDQVIIADDATATEYADWLKIEGITFTRTAPTA